MFEQLSARGILRDAATVPGVRNVTYSVADRRTGSVCVVAHVTRRTAGTIQVEWLASLDGGNSYDATLDDSGTISANGAVYLTWSGPLPPDLRIRLTPGGGFDGKVALYQRAGGLLAQAEQIE